MDAFAVRVLVEPLEVGAETVAGPDAIARWSVATAVVRFVFHIAGKFHNYFVRYHLGVLWVLPQ